MTKATQPIEIIAQALHDHALPSPLPPEQERHLARFSESDRNFAAHVPAEIANPQMELIILLPQTGGAS